MTTRISLQSGFGLVELMIAMTLGLLLSAAVMQVTLASKRSHSVLEASARLQEIGRFAAAYLARQVRTAGFMGCPNLSHIPVNVIASDPPEELDFTPDGVLVGEDNVAAANGYDAVAGTDVIVIQRASALAARLVGNLEPDNANIQIDNNPAGLDRGDFVFITDCVNADLFEATTVSATQSGGQITVAHGSNANDNNKLSKLYGEDAEIRGFESLAFFVRRTSQDTAQGQLVNALYVRARSLGSSSVLTQQLVEGVENMQLTYGVDSDGDRDVDGYFPAAAVSDWAEVLSVRIELLLHSLEDNVVGSSGEYVQNNLNFNGVPVAQDGRLRKVYTTSVAVRNRLP